MPYKIRVNNLILHNISDIKQKQIVKQEKLQIKWQTTTDI